MRQLAWAGALAVMCILTVHAPQARDQARSSRWSAVPLVDDEPLSMEAMLVGRWIGTPADLPLTQLQRTAWGDRARAVRRAELIVDSSLAGTLTVTTTIVNARGRVTPSAAVTERVEFVFEPRGAGTEAVTAYAPTIRAAERWYADDEHARWRLSGVQVRLTPSATDPSRLHVEYHTASGEGAFDALFRRADSRSTRNAS